MSIKAIISDYGGVLVKMVDETARFILAEEAGLPLKEIYRLVFESESANQAALGEITNDQHWENVRAGMRLPPAQLPGFITKFWSVDGPNTVFINYLRSQRPRYRIGLLSNAADDLRGMLINRWKIADLFDDMIISAEVHLVKPDARIYHLACSRLNVQPGQAVFIDDMPENVEGARAAGLSAIQYRTNEQVFLDLDQMLKHG